MCIIIIKIQIEIRFYANDIIDLNTSYTGFKLHFGLKHELYRVPTSLWIETRVIQGVNFTLDLNMSYTGFQLHFGFKHELYRVSTSLWI